MPITPSTLIYAKRIRGKGLGVFAKVRIPADTEIERVPVLVLPQAQLAHLQNGGILGDYAFTWSATEAAIALGYGSLYNHAYEPNAIYVDRAPRLKIFLALRDIQAHEEITINYNGEPDSRAPLDFTVT